MLKPGTRVQLRTGGGPHPAKTEVGTIRRWLKGHGCRNEWAGWHIVQFDGSAPLRVHGDGLTVVGKVA